MTNKHIGTSTVDKLAISQTNSTNNFQQPSLSSYLPTSPTPPTACSRGAAPLHAFAEGRTGVCWPRLTGLWEEERSALLIPRFSRAAVAVISLIVYQQWKCSSYYLRVVGMSGLGVHPWNMSTLDWWNPLIFSAASQRQLHHKDLYWWIATWFMHVYAMVCLKETLENPRKNGQPLKTCLPTLAQKYDPEAHWQNKNNNTGHPREKNETPNHLEINHSTNGKKYRNIEKPRKPCKNPERRKKKLAKPRKPWRSPIIKTLRRKKKRPPSDAQLFKALRLTAALSARLWVPPRLWVPVRAPSPGSGGGGAFFWGGLKRKGYRIWFLDGSLGFLRFSTSVVFFLEFLMLFNDFLWFWFHF